MDFIKKISFRVSRASLGLALVAVMGIGLSACGGNPTPAPTPTTAAQTAAEQANAGSAGSAGSGAGAVSDVGSNSGAAAQEVKADLKEWAIELPSTDLSAGKYNFVVSNSGKFNHNLTILDGSGTQVGDTPNFKGPDGPKAFEVDLKPGTYTFLCDIPGHPEQGMKTQVTVK